MTVHDVFNVCGLFTSFGEHAKLYLNLILSSTLIFLVRIMNAVIASLCWETINFLYILINFLRCKTFLNDPVRQKNMIENCEKLNILGMMSYIIY